MTAVLVRVLSVPGAFYALGHGWYLPAVFLMTYGLVSMAHAHKVRRHGVQLVRTGARRAATGRF